MDSDFTYKDENAPKSEMSTAENDVGKGAQSMQQSGSAAPNSANDIPLENGFDEKSVIEKIAKPESAQRLKGYKQQPCVEPLSVGKQGDTTEIYTQGYLKAQLSKQVNIFSLIGNSLAEHKGKLKKVGANFVVLDDGEQEQMICDLASIKFIKIMR